MRADRLEDAVRETSARREARTTGVRALSRGSLGATIYAALVLLSSRIPDDTANVALQLALAVIPLAGIRFGPVAGMVTGFVGNCVLAQINGDGFLALWAWSVANGLNGLTAGLIGCYLLKDCRPAQRVMRVAACATAGVGAVVTFTIFGVVALDTTIVERSTYADLYIAAAVNTEVAALLLVPILDQVFESLSSRKRPLDDEPEL
jgi:uncharacterized membrane protein